MEQISDGRIKLDNGDYLHIAERRSGGTVTYFVLASDGGDEIVKTLVGNFDDIDEKFRQTARRLEDE